MSGFLPICRADLDKKGWDMPDFVYVTGDAYVDHPSFAAAIISRVLENAGYRVAILAQPDPGDKNIFLSLGIPRLGFLVSSGNMDSMVNLYTVAKKRRDYDYYSPGGQTGLRPDYAVSAYCGAIRAACPGLPIIAGGIEASLRRLAHYDYWSDRVMPSLVTGDADLLIYGMGERAIVQIADRLAAGAAISEITDIKGTVFKTREISAVGEHIRLPSFSKVCGEDGKAAFAKSFALQYNNTDPFSAKRLVEGYADGLYAVQNPPQEPLSQEELDRVYSLGFMRDYHPVYKDLGGVPAIEEVKFSLASSRGCFGSCNFCALSFHQGRIIQGRSHDSLLREAEIITRMPDFKGYIHDVGGPTANFRRPACEKQAVSGACKDRRCLFPSPCKNLVVDHSDFLSLLRKLRALPGVKKVFIRSGIRFDYLCLDKDDRFFRELVSDHISGQLKVAPEHVSANVLRHMGKPPHRVYADFCERYKKYNRELGKKQYIVPYFMSSHPGSTLADAVELAEYIRDSGHRPEQVQDFYPTPSTVSTCMYYTGIDPFTQKPVFCAKSPLEKAMQRALIQYYIPANRELVIKALCAAKRSDLIGRGPKCLVHGGSGNSGSGNGGSGTAGSGNTGSGNTGGKKKQAPLPAPARGRRKKS